MGIKLATDIIANPSHAGGVITLPPSLLMLGGRQYRTGTLTRTIATDVALGANTLYFVYVQVVSGVPALRISTSVPSIYLVSNPTAKLVTAFYSSSNMVTSTHSFGVFVESVEDSPVFRNIPFTPNKNGFGTTASETHVWDREGGKLWQRGRFIVGSTTGVEARVDLPSVTQKTHAGVIIIAGTFTRNNAGGTATSKGGWVFWHSGVTYLTFSTANIFNENNQAQWDATVLANTEWAVNDRTSYDVKINVAEWSNKPLKDL